MVVKKFTCALIIVLSLIGTLKAESIKINTYLKEDVITLSDQLQLVLEITSDKQVKVVAPPAPQIPGFSFRNVIGSSSTEYSIANKQFFTTYIQTFTYIYNPQSTGTFTIPAFKVKVDKKDYYTTPLTVQVNESTYATTPQKQYNLSPFLSPFGDELFSPNRLEGEVFLLCIPETDFAYVGEPVIISYYLYTEQAIEAFYAESEKDFEGYGKAVFLQPSSLKYENSVYNGKSYKRALIKQDVIFPHKAGRLQMPILQGQAQFLGFLNKTISSKPCWINVKSLPAGAPVGFTGAVGNFTVSQSVSTTKLNLGDALTLTINISGRGNFSQFTAAPFPPVDKFQVSAPYIQDKLANEIEGTRFIHYTLLPRETGELTIPSYTFTWFDSNSGVYRTFKGTPQKIKVHQSNILSYFSGLLDKDKPQALNPLLNLSYYPNNKNYSTELWFWLILVLCALSLIISAFIARDNKLKELEPIAYAQKTAHRILNKYLRQATEAAEKLSSDFYPLAESGLMNYLARKYGISKSLTTSELIDALRMKGLPLELLDQLEEFLLFCQQARFMPGGAEAEKLDEALHQLRSLVQALSRFKPGKESPINTSFTPIQSNMSSKNEEPQ
ncbi:MAG: BatD family protein [Candidatus Cloacimonetes bacterium]|jgi:hypothetical protein|nr:BatD family protein [Candidatus Cloacimonadota bacterium]